METQRLPEDSQQQARWGTAMALASPVLWMESALLSMAFPLTLSLLPGHEPLIPDEDQGTPHGRHSSQHLCTDFQQLCALCSSTGRHTVVSRMPAVRTHKASEATDAFWASFWVSPVEKPKISKWSSQTGKYHKITKMSFMKFSNNNNNWNWRCGLGNNIHVLQASKSVNLYVQPMYSL